MADDEKPFHEAEPARDKPDNVIEFTRDRTFRVPPSEVDDAHDDDELLQHVTQQIVSWRQDAREPSLTKFQEMFHELIRAGGSPMLRDRVIACIIKTFGDRLGGKRALSATWGEITKQVAIERTANAHGAGAQAKSQPLSAGEIAALRQELWPSVRELAQAPDLMPRVIKQVHSMGVVNETDLIKLIYIAATSRILKQPINPLVKGASSGGKSFVTNLTLELIGPDFVHHLTTSSALSLVYGERPLSHTVLVIFEANQLQADENSVFSMLLRTLISEGKVIHETTIEDKDSETGRRAVRIEREGPICLIITTTGELHAENETRSLSYNVTESQQQTRSVMDSIAARAAGHSSSAPNLQAFHDLQHWIALGPNDAVIPFATQIVEKIPPSMVRFRRDVSALLSFMKASALLHQAQRERDAVGRVIATVADYALAYPIFSRIMAQSSGQVVTENIRAVVELIASRANPAPNTTQTGRFKRSDTAGSVDEIVISSDQVGLALGVNRMAAYHAIKAAIDLGFLANNETRPRKPFKLVVKQQIDDAVVALLPHPDTIGSAGGAA